MSLYKREGSPFWWVRFVHNGRRIQKSTGTAERLKARQYHDQLKAQLWEQDRLGVKPRRSWNEAVMKYLQESSHKATHEEDIAKLRYLDQFLGGVALQAIDRELVEKIAHAKAKEASPGTANRYLALVRAILRKATFDWEWIDKAPRVRLLPEPRRRIRWLRRDQADALLRALPPHQADMARFALATGLRQANVKGLEWTQIDMQRQVAWIHPDQAKARKAIPVPLNEEAREVIRGQIGRHDRYVFTYKGRPIQTVNTKAWKKGLRAAGIDQFRWHDLRHTWASWHVQAGTSMAELQELGGWETPEMVRRYAHLSSEHLAKAAARIVPLTTKVATAEKEEGARSR